MNGIHANVTRPVVNGLESAGGAAWAAFISSRASAA